MSRQCAAEYVSDQDGPTLTCGKRGFHLIHRDPATGIRYLREPWGFFCLCGFFRHRKTCPLR